MLKFFSNLLEIEGKRAREPNRLAQVSRSKETPRHEKFSLYEQSKLAERCLLTLEKQRNKHKSSKANQKKQVTKLCTTKLWVSQSTGHPPNQANSKETNQLTYQPIS